MSTKEITRDDSPSASSERKSEIKDPTPFAMNCIHQANQAPNEYQARKRMLNWYMNQLTLHKWNISQNVAASCRVYATRNSLSSNRSVFRVLVAQEQRLLHNQVYFCSGLRMMGFQEKSRIPAIDCQTQPDHYVQRWQILLVCAKCIT
eukprot:SAG31_NODE_1054_length_10140_cov_4.264316_11_plen_148_part_00